MPEVAALLPQRLAEALTADPASRAVEAVRREVKGPDGESATRIRVQTNQGRRTQSVNCKQPVCNGVVRPGPLALTP